MSSVARLAVQVLNPQSIRDGRVWHAGMHGAKEREHGQRKLQAMS